ncbi:MAG: FtsK/SpoIIIE domain-containing protein, partial [Anaerolineaceae bacterium]|nr:FtsK/SpoIIIE domain-containing protein [Anaerolineaceae bacterium]
TSDEEERVERVLMMIEDTLTERQKLFSEVGVSSLASYNKAFPKKPLPAVLVVIDNFAEFKEYYENLMGALISLVREARAFGVYFAISADMPNSLTNKLFNLITERFTLKLSDTSEYSTVVGRGVPADLSNVPGRGYLKVDGYPAEFRVNVPLEFQTALPFETESGTDITEKLSANCRRIAEIWNDSWKHPKPSPIETLPMRVLLKNVIDLHLEKPTKRLQAVLGIDDRTLSPLVIDLEKQGPHLMIVGAPLSGKTTTLRTMLLSLAFNFSSDEFMAVLIDFQRRFFAYGGERSLVDLPQVVDTISEVEQLDNLLKNLKVECEDFDKNPRRRKILIFIDNYDSFSEEGSRKNSAFFDDLAVLARKYQTAGLYILAAGSVQMTRAAEDVRKIIAMTNFGIGLKDSEAVNTLNG